ncbi:MAG: CRISPR-associated protein Cas4 [Anaerococcus sp.]|nr:CRISPR-associated protein Cas4 [Anaerococcus sp.]
MYEEDDYLMLSGIQHFIFCKRQWALIHIENIWEENQATAKGQLIHQKTDNPFIKEKRRNLIISRAIPVSSKRLGLSGILDTVEFYKSKEGIALKGKEGLWLPRIIEYKSGKAKKGNHDKAQLVAEAMCLEEELNIHLDKAYLYYHKTDTRQEVILDDKLRNFVIGEIRLMHEYYDKKILPKASFYRRCQECSINEACRPRLSKRPKSVEKYIYYEKFDEYPLSDKS